METTPNKSKYFAAKEGKETAGILLDRCSGWFLNLNRNGYLEKLRTMWAAYHGAQYTNFSDAHSITFGGEQGELTEITVNQIRNICNTIISMITATRPAMQSRAINTDYKSVVQTTLANGLLDYYMRDKRLERYLRKAVEYAVVMGSGFVKSEWNAMSGEVYDFNEELQTDIREGDIQFSNLSPFDVVFDLNREDDDHDWVVCRSKKNRYDLIAKYPEFAEKIEMLPSVKDFQGFWIDDMMKDTSDLVFVYEFFHKRTEAMPDGRYLLFLSEEIVLLDTPMPYRTLPIYCLKFADVLGTPLGYTDMFDLLPLQDALNAMYSAILTNNNAFAVQNILVPRGADVTISELSGGLNIVEANTSAGEIKALQLTATPSETFNFVGMLEKAMETISGVNAVTRGKPDPQLRSGNALALLQSMTLQYISKLQQSYVMLVEDLGTGIINMLKDFASVPRVATIVGVRNRSYMKEFTGEDLSSVSRVIVDIANPLANSSAGRVEMASELLQMGQITGQQYIEVIRTGNLDVAIENGQSQLNLIRNENERLLNGDPVIAAFVDNHALHVQEHASVLEDSELRMNPELVERVMAHIQEHIQLLKTLDPQLLQVLGQQSLAPMPQPQQPPAAPGPESAQTGNIQDNMSPPQGNMPSQLAQMGVDVNLPSIAQPAEVPGFGVPPSTPEQMMMMGQNG